MAATSTTLAASPNPSASGQAVTFTATVGPVAPATGTPTGTVTFKDGSTTLGTGTLSGGAATFTTSALAVGTHSITAAYGGDASFAASTSAALSQVVNQAAVGPGPFSIFSPSATPGVASDPDSSATEVGVKFYSDVDGFITGIRFYKGAGNTGTHIGNLWTAGGTLLATATFANETASGWQQVLFATPVAITANTIYVASYFAPNGHYADDVGYFASAGVDSPPLHALATGQTASTGCTGTAPEAASLRAVINRATTGSTSSSPPAPRRSAVDSGGAITSPSGRYLRYRRPVHDERPDSDGDAVRYLLHLELTGDRPELARQSPAPTLAASSAAEDPAMRWSTRNGALRQRDRLGGGTARRRFVPEVEGFEKF